MHSPMLYVDPVFLLDTGFKSEKPPLFSGGLCINPAGVPQTALFYRWWPPAKHLKGRGS